VTSRSTRVAIYGRSGRRKLWHETIQGFRHVVVRISNLFDTVTKLGVGAIEAEDSANPAFRFVLSDGHAVVAQSTPHKAEEQKRELKRLAAALPNEVEVRPASAWGSRPIWRRR
jgi:hypothetical protein